MSTIAATEEMAEDLAGRRGWPLHIVVFLAPAVLVYSLFSIYPLIDTIRLSLFTTDEAGLYHFVGLDNFGRLIGDPTWSGPFWNAFRNNLVFFAIHMVVQNGIGLGLAMLLSLPDLAGRNLYRTLIFLPTMLSVVIIGFIWQLMLSPLWGVAETFLGFFGLGGYFGPWLGQETTALATISLISVWQFIGIPMMLIYAALLNIPDDLVDAATVDGAGPFHVFWQVKLPLIVPTLGIVSILTFVANFNAFDLIYAVKGALAGPNFSTDILGTFFYRTFFGYQLQVGNPTMGATVATMMLMIILVGVLIYLFGVQRRLQRHTF
ncbi:sugar ABC transporter permease [Chelatococcus sp. SYSU_G07232]|uniref:Sugar ABC transporter permease n=1 Tax=Chelatococcus albus TaxID=3047466 RepID=A0ABT7AH59_9HYPH|nr:sugar ABC transporter permease [Chelatococcus sp. SYSU_G07232]MDJ1158169.1 sugar ABC transporter permease [Chelatococcus sp. SYSU_G07232]